ncbi:MAG: hypothetical protein IPL06_22350 [Betaproteobacteria bacterium]|nr:hypothetical protein [Betaproteobacteria bacterium]
MGLADPVRGEHLRVRIAGRREADLHAVVRGRHHDRHAKPERAFGAHGEPGDETPGRLRPGRHQALCGKCVEIGAAGDAHPVGGFFRLGARGLRAQRGGKAEFHVARGGLRQQELHAFRATGLRAGVHGHRNLGGLRGAGDAHRESEREGDGENRA